MEPWEKYAETESGPWTKYSAPADNYLPDTEALRKGFSGDPLAVFEPSERSRIEGILNTYDNPAEEAKKHVISQYLAPRVGMPPEAVLNNFQSVADIYFKQQNIGIEKAYQNIASVLNPAPVKAESGAAFRWATPEDLNKAPSGIMGAGAKLVAGITNPANDKTFAGQLVNSAARGTARLATGAAAYPDMLARQTVDVVNAGLWNIPVTLAGKPEWQIWYNESIMGTRSNPLKASADAAGMIQHSVENNLAAENIQGDLLQNVKSGDYGNAGKIIAYGIAENVPQFAGLVISNNPTLLGAKLQSLSQSQRVETLSNMWLTLMGASAAGGKRIELENKPGDAGLKDFDATMTGVFEVTTEKLFALPIVEKMFKGNPEGRKSAMKACAETIFDVFKAGSGEASSQLGENLTDIGTGLGSQPWHSGLLESFIIGGLLEGSPAAVNLFRAVGKAPKMSYFEYDQLSAEIKQNAVEPRRQELLNKLNLTDAEVAELRKLDNISVNDFIAEDLIRQVEPASEAGKTIQQMQTEGLRDFMRSRPDASTRFAHDPAETMNAVTEQAQAFPGVNIVAVDNEASLPEEIKAQIEQQTAAGRVRGLFNAPSQTVYIMSDKVAPADVPLVLLHETVGHLGLRRAFGQQLDPLLDGIFRDYSKDIIAGNESGRWGFNLTDDLTGENDLAGQQRQAAEEFIANTAEKIHSGEVRPMWWKGLIVRFKQALRNVPGLKNMRFTDRELEGVLFIASRAAGRAGNYNSSNDIRFMTMPQLTRLTEKLESFKSELDGVEMNPEQQGIYDVITGNAKTAAIRKNDLGLLEESILLHEGGRNKGGKKIIEAHYAGTRGRVTAEEIINMGEVIRKGKFSDGNNPDYPTSHVYDFTADDGANLRVVIDLDKKKNESVINFYSDRSETRGNKASPRKTTDSKDSIQPDSGNVKFSLAPSVSGKVNTEWIDKKAKELKDDLELTNSMVNSPLSKAGPVDNYNETAKIKLLDKIKSGANLDVLEQQYLNDIKTDNEINIDAYGNIGLLKLVREARRNSVRFSLASMPGADIEALGKILLQGVADGSIKSDVDAGEYFKKQGITSLELHEIQFAYGEARYQLKQLEARRLKFEYKNWLASQHPILSGIEERLGVNKIKVDKKFGKQKEFAGAYVDYKNGMASDEAAQILGVDEADLVEAVRGVKKNDLKAQFKTWRAESSPDAYYAKLAEADRAREVEGMIDDVLAGQLKLSNELRAKYPEVADAVYQRITGNPGKAPADFDWLAAAAQLEHSPQSDQSNQSDKSDPAAGSGGFMAGFAAGRQQAAQEYQDLIAAVKANQDDITASQKLLKEYAFKHLPKGERDLALKKITQLSEASSTPTAKYPKGQRHALLEEIFNQIQKQRENLMRNNLLERIQERLKQTTVKRGQTGKPIGKYGAEAQTQLDRIREITRLTPGMVYNEQSYWQDMAEMAQNEGGDPSHALAQVAMLETFGVLDGKNSEQLVTALAEIQRLAHDGRMELMKIIQSRRLDIENMRGRMIDEVSGKAGLMSPQDARIEEHRRAGNKVREGLYKYWRQNLNFPWLMNNITRLSGKALKDTQSGKFVDAEHKAEQKEMTGRRSRANAFNDAFDKIFGTGGNVSRGREYVALRKMENNTGVFRFQRPSGGEKGLKYERMTPDEAREMLNDHKEGKARLLDYEVECLKHQLDDIDAGEKYKSSQSQPVEDEIMQHIADENRERMVTLPRIADPGDLVQQPLTQGEALHVWLNWQQPNVRYKMQFNGWTADSIKQLETFLRPEARKLGEWMRNELEKDFPAVNEAFRNQYYTDMPHSPDYFPTAYNVKGGISDNTKDAFGMPFGMASVSPGALKSRRFHLMEPAANDAFSTYAAHVVQMEHFKAVSANISDMRGVFNNPDVRSAITQYRGEQAYTDLVNSVTILADGGRRDAAKISFISGMYAPWVASKLMINLQSATKQLAGVFAYVNSIPAAPFAKGVAAFWAAPVDNARMLMETDYFKNRWSGAMDRDLNMLLDWSSSVAGKNSGWMHELVQNGSILNKSGDALSVVIGGYAVYKYHYDNLIKRGVEQQQAHDQAIVEWEKASDATQQSGAIKDMNYFQMGGTIDRMMTTYMSNPILVMQAQTETLFDALSGRNTAENAAKFGRMVMINHIIVPALMTGIVQAIKNRDNWDEYELSDFIVSSLLGPFNALFLLGKGLDSIVPLLMGEYRKAASTFPVIDDISHAFSQGKRIAEGNADLTTDEVLKAIANTGAALTPFSNTAAVLGAAGRESRRWWNFFTGDGDKKKKHKPEFSL